MKPRSAPDERRPSLANVRFAARESVRLWLYALNALVRGDVAHAQAAHENARLYSRAAVGGLEQVCSAASRVKE